MSNGTPRDPDDFFAETRMSFGDHIEDLRQHLFRAIAGFLVALVVSFFVGKPVLAIITEPVESQLRAFYNRRLDKKKLELEKDPGLNGVNKPTEFTQIAFRHDQLAALIKGESIEAVNGFKKPVVVKPKAPDEEVPWWQRLPGFGSEQEEKPLGENEEAIKPEQLVKLWVRHETPADDAAGMIPAFRNVAELDTLATLSVTEAFMVYFKVCLLCALVLGSPWIFYQIWSFIAAGLYPHEKRLVNVYLPVSLGLFLAGVFMCQIVVIPRAIEALLWFNEWIGLKPDLRLENWLGFAIMLPVVFGVSFQTPLVMMFVARIGIMTAQSFRKHWRLAYFLLAVFAAVITPTPDMITMLMLWVPMAGLFELGILLIKMSPQRVESEMEESEEDRLIEV